MDEVTRTLETYEGDAEHFVEKYRGGSVPATYGGSFFEALSGDRVLDVGCGPGSDAAATLESFDAFSTTTALSFSR